MIDTNYQLNDDLDGIKRQIEAISDQNNEVNKLYFQCCH